MGYKTLTAYVIVSSTHTHTHTHTYTEFRPHQLHHLPTCLTCILVKATFASDIKITLREKKRRVVNLMIKMRERVVNTLRGVREPPVPANVLNTMNMSSAGERYERRMV